MNIISKFNIGDEVYFMNNNQVCKDIIKYITITYNIYSDTKVITSTSQKNIYNLKNDHKNDLGDIRYNLIFTDDDLFFHKRRLNYSFMTALELINIICPEHNRTSCSDDNLGNGFYSEDDETFFENQKFLISNEHMPRCTRCALLGLANGTSTDDNKVIETTSIYLKQ